MDRTTACTPGVAAVRLLPLLLLLGSVAVSESQLYDEVLRREVSPTEDLQLHLQLTERDDEMLVWWMTPNAVPSEVRYRLKQEDRTRDRPSRSDARVLPPGSVAGDGGDGEWMLAINATGGPYNYWYVGLPDRNVDPATGIPGYLSNYIHEVYLTGLQKGRLPYEYQVRTGEKQGEEWSQTFELRTRPLTPDESVGFAFVSDQDVIRWGRNGDENNKARPVLEGLLKKQDDFDVVIHGGDLAYARGRQGEWDAFGRFMQPLTSRRPMQVAVGNQEEEERADDDPPCDADGNCPKRFGGYTLRWRNGEGRRLEDGSVTQAFWYSFDYGAVHVAVISSEHDKGHDVEAMSAWLEKDLLAADEPEARSVRPWVVLVVHRPMHNNFNGDGECGNNGCLSRDIVDAVEPLLLRYRVQIVLGGHCHSYDRTYPMYRKGKERQCAPDEDGRKRRANACVMDWDDGAPRRPYITHVTTQRSDADTNMGPIHVIAGTGGRNGNGCKEMPWSAANANRRDNIRGFALFTADRTSLHFKMLDIDGLAVHDEFKMSPSNASIPAAASAPASAPQHLRRGGAGD
eukprot:jgi/Tetstr1/453353/TSEL_040344.t1